MKHIYLTAVAIFALVAQGFAQVKITEIMYDPQSSESNGAWEWVELYNPTSAAVSLNGYVIDDGNGVYQTSSNIANATIPAGGAVVLYNSTEVSASDFQAAWGTGFTLVAVSGWNLMSLNNSGDHVGVWSSYADFQSDTLADGSLAFAKCVSHVEYDDDGTIWVDNNGQSSIFLRHAGADVSVPANWLLSNTNDGISWQSTANGGNSGSDIGSPGAVPPAPFALQLLHYSDVDGNEELALDVVDEFSGLVDGLKHDATYGNNTLFVSSGDIIIPGPRFYAAEDNKVRGYPLH